MGFGTKGESCACSKQPWCGSVGKFLLFICACASALSPTSGNSTNGGRAYRLKLGERWNPFPSSRPPPTQGPSLEFKREDDLRRHELHLIQNQLSRPMETLQFQPLPTPNRRQSQGHAHGDDWSASSFAHEHHHDQRRPHIKKGGLQFEN